jgi:hypothetical protein
VDIIEGWFPFFTRAEGDYEGIPPPAVAEVYVRVSFAKRRAHSGYCEEVRLENPIAQPMDSYSNVVFIMTGLHMLGVGALDAWRMAATRRMAASGLPLTVPDQYALPGVGAGMNPYAALSQMEQFPVYSVANGLVQFYAGLSSFLFHASMTALGQRLDMAGVYMLVVSPSLYMMLRLGAFGPPSSRTAHAAFAAATAVAAYAFYKYKWQLERYTGGSTNLVLDLVAIMAALIVRLSLLLSLVFCLVLTVPHCRRCGCGRWARRTRATRRRRGVAAARGEARKEGAAKATGSHRRMPRAAAMAVPPPVPRRAATAQTAQGRLGSLMAGCLA